ncbi:MAG: hypothetical protein KA712_12220 [Myxococcales bacterium]|nr:hypothetical protein [Myxococcales bacterium]
MIVPIWFTSAVALLLLGLLTQSGGLTWWAPLAALLNASPLAYAVLRGQWPRGGYPTPVFLVISMWLLFQCPSMLVIDPLSRMVFIFSDESIFVGHLLFSGFTILVVHIASTRVAAEAAWTLEPEGPLGFVILVAVFIVACAFSATIGVLNPYAGAVAPAAGSLASVFSGLTRHALQVGLALCLFAALRWPSLRMLSYGAGFSLAAFVLLSASRRAQLSNLALCLVALRVFHIRLSIRRTIAIGGLVCISLLTVVVYRNQVSARGAFGFGIVADSVIKGDQGLVDATLTNLETRYWYAQQYFAAVSNFLESGPAMAGTYLEGIVRAVPSLIWPQKNDIANRYTIEEALWNTHRFPRIDLGPTPWLQAVFEFGWLGLAVAAIVYGVVLRQVQRTLTRVSSFRSFFLSGALFSIIALAESRIDTLILDARDPILLFLAISFVAKTPSNKGASCGARIGGHVGPVLSHAQLGPMGELLVSPARHDVTIPSQVVGDESP